MPTKGQELALSCAVTSEPIASSSHSISLYRLFFSADVSTNSEEDQGLFLGK